MDEIKLRKDENGDGAFYILEGEEQLGEMVFSVTGPVLTVHHTEVSDEAEGKGFAKKLLSAVSEYARTNQLKIIPRCSYVRAQFKRHPEEYEDVWEKK